MNMMYKQTLNKLLRAQMQSVRRFGNTVDQMASSVDPSELKKFRELADQWWSLQGPFKGLHILNPSRCLFIRKCVCSHFGVDFESLKPFRDLNFLDVGCGGGILSESLARMGANVTGIDAEESNIKVAKSHVQQDEQIATNIKYEHVTAEELLEQGQKFDVVVASEVIEHVRQPKLFMNTLSSLTKPSGGVVVTTLNRNVRSYLLAIVAAEYLLNVVEPGTHQWEKFLTPQELAMISNEVGLEMSQVAGIWVNPLTQKSSLMESTDINYAAYFKKLQTKQDAEKK
eukprot:TRINITY_DN21645_c0_g1_i2.p1 TRINITY_DN21645_c0_g1~~TRINITY_DN21645_c0_g1_i2.p1  ORF type:complete len:285 (-),score=31.24 TRINITY_DN21645_c0_g1_i2:170-1024(-)